MTLERSDGAALPGARWLATADTVDERALARACPPVLDVGCGPGRHTVELAERGVVVMGIDVTAGALALARARGASVLQRCVFDPLPGAGRWASALLLDGNIAIGADPVRLLGRLRGLLRPGGVIVVEFDRGGSTLSAARRTRRRGACTPRVRRAPRPVVPVAAGAGARRAAPGHGREARPARAVDRRRAGVRSVAAAMNLHSSVDTVRRFGARAPRSEHHDDRNAALLGIALGVCFTVCFATGLYSHALQTPPSWFTAFPRPAGLYRFTQGLHVATGLATLPLLLAKLWTVYPKLFAWPPFAGVASFLERIMLLPLVGGSLFLLLSGINDVNLNYRWYVFNFRPGHYRAAWITVGALVIHVGAKVAGTRHALRRGSPVATDTSRRGFLTAVFGTAGFVALVTVGQTLRPLERLALLSPRRPGSGAQGFPVNRTAAEAGTARVDATTYRLTVDGAVAAPREFTLDELRALPQREAVLPIACVEGWSASKRWRGVPLAQLLDLVGAPHDATVRVVSLQRGGAYRTSDVVAAVARDRDALLALAVEGQTLAADHGFPVRLIAPNRPGVLQTKWVHRIEVSRP